MGEAMVGMAEAERSQNDAWPHVADQLAQGAAQIRRIVRRRLTPILVINVIHPERLGTEAPQRPLILCPAGTHDVLGSQEAGRRIPSCGGGRVRRGNPRHDGHDRGSGVSGEELAAAEDPVVEVGRDEKDVGRPPSHPAHAPLPCGEPVARFQDNPEQAGSWCCISRSRNATRWSQVCRSRTSSAAWRPTSRRRSG